MGSLPAEIRRTGRLTLTNDGRIEAHHDNGQKIGEIVVGIDGVYFDGFEPIFTQRNDPPKLRLAARYDSGVGGGGCISFNRLRPDDRMEEQVMINCGSLDNPVDDRGQFRVLIRCSDAAEDWKVAFVATTHELGRIWTGACNWLGWLWKLNNVGDQPPTSGPGSSSVGRFYTGGGSYCCIFNEEDGALVFYATHNSGDESTWTPLWAIRQDGTLERIT